MAYWAVDLGRIKRAQEYVAAAQRELEGIEERGPPLVLRARAVLAEAGIHLDFSIKEMRAELHLHSGAGTL